MFYERNSFPLSLPSYAYYIANKIVHQSLMSKLYINGCTFIMSSKENRPFELRILIIDVIKWICIY